MKYLISSLFILVSTLYSDYSPIPSNPKEAKKMAEDLRQKIKADIEKEKALQQARVIADGIKVEEVMQEESISFAKKAAPLAKMAPESIDMFKDIAIPFEELEGEEYEKFSF